MAPTNPDCPVYRAFRGAGWVHRTPNIGAAVRCFSLPGSMDSFIGFRPVCNERRER